MRKPRARPRPRAGTWRYDSEVVIGVIEFVTDAGAFGDGLMSGRDVFVPFM